MSKLREWLSELDEEIMLFDNLDDAFIGLAHRQGQPTLAVYDWWLIIDVLMRDGIDDLEDAIEYLEFNIACAWFGPNTPLILERPEWLYLEQRVM